MKTKFFLLFSFVFLWNSCQDAATDPDGDGADEVELATSEEVQEKPKKIIFFGDSLTAAYGLDPGEGFPAIIQEQLRAEGFDYQVVNAGLSGETTAGGNERVDWVLQQDVDIFILELGGNDGLRGLNPENSYQNLQSIVKKVQEKAPEAKIILAGMEAPPNMGQEYTSAFRNVFARLAKEENLSLIPFLLKNVGGIKELNLPDGIHPNQEGQKIVAQNVWEILEGVLEK